jgi:tRNA-splicing ligase RtcB
MCAVKTSLTEIDTITLKKIMGEIRRQIPVGKNHNKDAQDESLMPFVSSITSQKNKAPFVGDLPIVNSQYSSALKQIGTLGGGNHFIEIQKGNDGHIWIMIHSGSRNLGKQVADHYVKLAYELNKKWNSSTYLPKNVNDSLGFFPIDSDEGQSYLKEMQYCVDFALANRKLMMHKVTKIFADIYAKDFNTENYYGDDEMINIAHNYARMENHFGHNVMVHRKGATLAQDGTIGIIPGSQGSKSYIVKGLGNIHSFQSCSHGAGRMLGRKQAVATLNLADEIKKLDDMGVIHGIRNQADLEEAASAYKNIDEVMAAQSDLVEIMVELTPLAVVKG